MEDALSNTSYEIKPNACNTILCIFLLVGLFFGVLFYDFIDNYLHFSYIDEMLALFLCLFTLFVVIHDQRIRVRRYWIGLLGVFLFYVGYSFNIDSNTKSAILQDLLVELKPFLGFYCASTIGTELTRKQKKIIQQACIVSICLLLMTTPQIYFFMGHPSRYATAAIFIAMLYLFVSDFNKKNLIVFILLLSVAIFSGRSKAFGFVMLASILSIIYYKQVRFRFTFKSLVSLLLILGLVVLVSWEKIYFYFIMGAQNITTADADGAFARPAMYWGAWQVLCDYFPFGSGFASFATFLSAENYSAIYSEYGLNHLQGLSEEMPDFIADAYYPSLAQYGFVGIFIFIYFWASTARQALKFRWIEALDAQKYIFIVIGVILFFGIELVADTTLTHNRGFFMMMLMGLSLRLLTNRYAINKM